MDLSKILNLGGGVGGEGAKFKGGPTVLEGAMKPNHVMVVVLN